MIRILSFLFTTASFAFLSTSLALAADPRIPQIPRPENLPGCTTEPCPNGVEFFVGFLGKFIVAVIGSLGILAVFFVLYGGVRIMLSGNNADAAKAGWTTIMHALIGLLVASLSYAIVELVIELPFEVMSHDTSSELADDPSTKSPHLPDGSPKPADDPSTKSPHLPDGSPKPADDSSTKNPRLPQ